MLATGVLAASFAFAAPAFAGGENGPPPPPPDGKEKCNSGRGNGNEGCDPGNSGGVNRGGDDLCQPGALPPRGGTGTEPAPPNCP
jgi:hypothetical protein